VGEGRAEADEEEIGFPEEVPSTTYLRIFVGSK
jgi:hypothetical protein